MLALAASPTAAQPTELGEPEASPFSLTVTVSAASLRYAVSGPVQVRAAGEPRAEALDLTACPLAPGVTYEDVVVRLAIDAHAVRLTCVAGAIGPALTP